MTERLRVLVIDDQPIILEALRQMLAEATDLDVRLHADCTTAAETAVAFDATVILLDINMEPLSGLDVLLRIRAQPRLTDVPVVMLSMAEEPEVKVESFRRGANDYVVKLPSALELIARVRYHARACLASREREAAFQALLESRAALEQRNAEIEEQKARLELMNRDLAESAITDPLTGLRNRRYLRLFLDCPGSRNARPMRNDQRQPQKGAGQTLYLLDLDHFKHINDHHGHDAGDAVLVEVARRLRTRMRDEDAVLRWGGEEFLVIAGGHDVAGAVALAERILVCVGAEPIRIGVGRELRVTCSMGFAPFPWSAPGAEASAMSLDQVLSLADVGSYLGKTEGRNRAFGVYPGGDPEFLRRVSDLATDPAVLRREHGRGVRLHALLGPQSERQHPELLLR